ncbi:MAG: hypothetical protein U5K30_09855 [Acidimicrobiales bacterium]|nr:hypothetical protein [Acidimicrobiales bacterium]
MLPSAKEVLVSSGHHRDEDSGDLADDWTEVLPDEFFHPAEPRTPLRGTPPEASDVRADPLLGISCTLYPAFGGTSVF